MALGTALLEPVPNPFFGVEAAGGLASLETIERGQLLRPFPQFRDVLALGVTEGKSRYNALTFQLDKRVSSGWGGRFGYTFSQLKDNQFGETNFYTNRVANAPQNNYDLEAEYSLGLLDMPHKITLAPIVELPWGQGRRYLTEPGITDFIIGGWTFSAIVTFESGYPIGVGQTANNCLRVDTAIGGNIQQRPNLAGGDPVNPGNITDRLDEDLADNQYLESERMDAGAGVHLRQLAADGRRLALAVPDELGPGVQQVVPDRRDLARRHPLRDPECVQPAEVRRVRQLDVRQRAVRPRDDAGGLHADLADQLPVRVLGRGIRRRPRKAEYAE